MGASEPTRATKRSQAFALSALRAPVGSPSLYSRAAANKIQPRIQILARPTRPSIFEDKNLEPACSSSTYSSLSSAAQSDSTHLTESLSSEMASHGDDLNENPRIFASGDGIRLPLARSGRSLEGTESPRSSAPISLEDYLKVKPIRGGRKGSRLVASFGFDDDNDSPQCQPTATRRASNIQNILEEVPESILLPVETVKESQNEYPNFPNTSYDLIFDYPQDITEANGSFRRAFHGNGDMSVFQWSLPDFSWSYVGRIRRDRQGAFALFLKQIYGKTQYGNSSELRLRRARITTMVKQFCESAGTPIVSERASSPLSRKIYSYQRQKAVPEAQTGGEPPSTQPLPARTVLNGHLEQISPEPVPSTLPARVISRSATQSSYFSNASTEDVFFPGQHVPREKILQGSYIADSREDYRERERHRIQQSLAASQRQQDALRDQASRTSSAANMSEKLAYTPHQYSDCPVVSNRNIDFGNNDLRRTVFQDPYQAASASNAHQRTIASNSYQSTNVNDPYQSNAVSNTYQGISLSNPNPSPAPTYPYQSAAATRHSVVRDVATAFPADFRGGTHQGIQSSDSSRLQTPGPLLSGDTLRQSSEPDAGWRDRAFTAPVQPSHRSHLTDEELRISVPLVPHLANGWKSEDRENTYREGVEAFWSSGTKSIARAKEYVSRRLSASDDTIASNTDSQSALSLAVPLYLNLQAYTSSWRNRTTPATANTSAQQQDYFARFMETFEGRVADRVVENEDVGGSSIQAPSRAPGDKGWTAAPERIGRDPRYRPLPIFGLAGTGPGAGLGTRRFG